MGIMPQVRGALSRMFDHRQGASFVHMQVLQSRGQKLHCQSRIPTRGVSLWQTGCSLLVLPGLHFVHATAFWLLLLRLFHNWPYNVPAWLWFDCHLRLGVQLVCCWNCRSRLASKSIFFILLFSVCRSQKNRMTGLQLHTCVFQTSLSSVDHLSGFRDLVKALSFQIPDSVHKTHCYTHFFRHQIWRWQLVFC